MKTTNILMGITAVLMAVMFVSVGIQGSLPQTAQHVHEKTMVQENRYNSYLISNPVNASDQLSNMFISWISGIEHANPYVGGKVSAFHMPSQAQVKELFPIFLKQNPNAVRLLNQITGIENAKFQKENHEMGMRFIRTLKNRTKLPKICEYSTNNSKFILVNIAHPMYPGGFPTSTGEYVMVSMTYYSIHCWFVNYNYGEQDTINILYVGSDAQTWYNTEQSTIGDITDMALVSAAILATATWLAGIYHIASLTSKVGIDIAFILAMTGIAVSAIQGYISSQLSSMYDSTYANPLNGEPKFLWTYYSIADIYAGMGSSFTWNGYTNTGTVSMLPYIPIASNNPAFAFVAVALSTETHQIAGKIGWNSWGTES